MPFETNLKSLLDFSPNENPSWRSKSTEFPSIKDAIKEISEYVRKEKERERRKKTFFIDEFVHHCLNEEEHGFRDECKTREFVGNYLEKPNVQAKSVEEIQTRNLVLAMQGLQKYESDPDFGYLDEYVIRQVNWYVGLDLEQKSNTKFGDFSKNRRITSYKGEVHEYKNPEDMELAVIKIVDEYNELFRHCQEDENEERRILNMFKACANFVWQFLDNLHPFSDGNGRTARMLASYILSTFSPFPTPLFNLFSESSKGDFTEALRAARNKPPSDLTTMMIECNLFCWRKLADLERA